MSDELETYRVPVMVEVDVEAEDLLDAELLAATLIKKTLHRATRLNDRGQVVISEQLNGRRFEAELVGRIKSVTAAARNGELTIASTAQVVRWKNGAEG